MVCSGVSDYAVHAPAELVADLAVDSHGLLLAGDGVERFPDRVRARSSTRSSPAAASRRRASAALVELATARAEREEFEQPAELRPLYLRRSDAEIAWDHRADADGGAR